MSHDEHSKYEHEIVRHDPKEGFDDTEPESGKIFVFTIVTVIVLVAVIGALQVYFNQIWKDSVYTQVLAVPGAELQEVRNLDTWRLNHYEYTDASKTTVRIPLEQAKQLILQDAAAGKTFYPAKPTEPKPETAPAPAPAAGAPAAAAEKK